MPRVEWLCGQRLTKNVSFVSSARDFYLIVFMDPGMAAVPPLLWVIDIGTLR